MAIWSYLTDCGRFYFFKQTASQKNGKELAMKECKKLFTNYDLLSDKERESNLYVFTIEEYIKQKPKLAIFSKNYNRKKTYEDLCEAL